MADETPSKYPTSVEVTALIDTSPLPSETKALLVVRLAILLKAKDAIVVAFPEEVTSPVKLALVVTVAAEPVVL